MKFWREARGRVNRNSILREAARAARAWRQNCVGRQEYDIVQQGNVGKNNNPENNFRVKKTLRSKADVLPMLMSQ